MKLDKNTQIILALGSIAVGALAVVEFSNGFNSAESSAGTGAGVALAVVGLGVGIAAIVGVGALAL